MLPVLGGVEVIRQNASSEGKADGTTPVNEAVRELVISPLGEGPDPRHNDLLFVRGEMAGDLALVREITDTLPPFDL